VPRAPVGRDAQAPQQQLHKMDACWRAANDLSVDQIYLHDNPLCGPA
jgi:phosphoketolase